MGMSLAFHIIFAMLGIGLPVLMAIAEAIYLRTHAPVFLELSKRWARGRSGSVVFVGREFPRSLRRLLIIALCAGAILLLPSLIFLLRVFKGAQSH